MSSSDEEKELLARLLSDLYGRAARQAVGSVADGRSYLLAGDNQFLGEIDKNSFSQNSLLNEYGPFGSSFSPTSIFNEYCPYGGPYGTYSPKNPYCANPPRIFVSGRYVGRVSDNLSILDRIPFGRFLYLIKDNIEALLALAGAGISSLSTVADSEVVYLEAADGTFLGNLNPNPLDTLSIFNKYGPHGNQYSEKSIFNRYSEFGNRYGPLSPYNPYSTSPPSVKRGNGEFIVYVTASNVISPRISADELLSWAKQHVARRYG